MIFTFNQETAEGFDYGDEGQHNADSNNTGQKCTRSSLIQKLQEHFGDVSLCYVHKSNGHWTVGLSNIKLVNQLFILFHTRKKVHTVDS